jgi:hypothetical protein
MAGGHRRYIGVIIVSVLVPMAVARIMSAAAVDLPQLDGIQAQTRALEDIFKQAGPTTEKYLEQARERERRECEGLYRRIPADQYLVPNEVVPAFQALSRDLNAVVSYIKPLADLNQEVAKRRAELAGLADMTAGPRPSFRQMTRSTVNNSMASMRRFRITSASWAASGAMRPRRLSIGWPNTAQRSPGP